MKKKAILTLLLALALLLTACGGEISREAAMSLLGGGTGTGTGRDDIVPYEQMEYVRPSVEPLKAQADKTSALLDRGGDLDAILDGLIACNAAYFTFYTMSTLAELHSCADQTDASWAAEYDFCDSASVEVEQILDQLYVDCANSDRAEELEQEYFGDGFLDYYGADYTGYADETYASLMQQETDLLREYRQLRAGLGDEGGAGSDETPELAELDPEDEMSYYNAYTDRYGDIYIRLVRVRNELARYCGYESYGDYAFDIIYGRDYTLDEAEGLAADIRMEIAPLYEELTEQGAWGDYLPGTVSESEVRSTLAAAAADMGGDIAETWDFLDENHLYDIAVSDKKVNTSFQTYLEDYEAPYAFVKTDGSDMDLLTFAHEFGHCVDSYYNYNDTNSLELAETFSQGMEYLLLGELSGEMQRSLTGQKLMDTVDTYAQQGSFFAFEQQVYSLPDEELTVEKINDISLQVAKDYGYYTEGYDDYYAKSWIDITHFFEYPYYVISYCVSNDAAFQLYEREQAEQGSGLAVYNDLLPRDHDDFLETVTEQGGLESPFAPGRMASTAAAIRAALG